MYITLRFYTLTQSELSGHWGDFITEVFVYLNPKTFNTSPFDQNKHSDQCRASSIFLALGVDFRVLFKT